MANGSVLAGLFGAILVFMMSAEAARACPVCIDLPKATVAQRLLEAEAAIIAREDAKSTFRFASVEVLKGSAEGPPIPFLLDRSTRRRLALNPDEGVVLLRDAGGAWSRAGYADGAWRGAVEAILAAESAWREYPDARFAFFASMIHDPDPDLRRLAVDELSRAPYGLIRGMARPIDGRRARQALVDRTMIPWAPFHILMLGLSERVEDHALVRRKLDSAARAGDGRLVGALATALVEIDAAAGVDRLVHDWVGEPRRDAEAVRAVVVALGVHARQGDPNLRPMIRTVLRATPAARPEVAGTVAAILGELGDFSQADVVEAALLRLAREEGIEGLGGELMAASLYIHRARRVGMRTALSPEPGP